MSTVNSGSLVYEVNNNKLEPYINPERARTIALEVAANLTVAKGDRLAQIASSGKYTALARTLITAPVAGPTVAAAGADGTLAVGDYQVAFSYITASGETTISPASAVTVGATNHIAVSALTPLPTGATGVNVYISDAGGTDLHFAYTNNGAVHNILAPVVSAVEPPTTNTAYNVATGAQTPKVISVFDFVSDANGNVFYGTTVPTTGVLADAQPTALGYYTGDFLKSQLPGITDSEIAAFNATLLGTGADTIVRLP